MTTMSITRPRDQCEVCLGSRGGVRGNENRIKWAWGTTIMCNYCHAAMWDSKITKAKIDSEKLCVEARLTPHPPRLWGMKVPIKNKFIAAKKGVLFQHDPLLHPFGMPSKMREDYNTYEDEFICLTKPPRTTCHCGRYSINWKTGRGYLIGLKRD